MQTGDPTHSGKGGNSIWGKKFKDEFKESLKVSNLTGFYYYLFIFIFHNFVSYLKKKFLHLLHSTM